MARTLILLRHAKAANPGQVHDHERPLQPHGTQQGELTGNWLRELQRPVDRILCSTALRTRMTLDATGVEAPTTYTDDLYNASARSIVARIAEIDDTVDTLLVVGHSPGIPEAALLLDDESNPSPRAQILDGFPTAAAAVMSVPGSWSALPDTGAELVDVHTI